MEIKVPVEIRSVTIRATGVGAPGFLPHAIPRTMRIFVTVGIYHWNKEEVKVGKDVCIVVWV